MRKFNPWTTAATLARFIERHGIKILDHSDGDESVDASVTFPVQENGDHIEIQITPRAFYVTRWLEAEQAVEAIASTDDLYRLMDILRRPELGLTR